MSRRSIGKEEGEGANLLCNNSIYIWKRTPPVGPKRHAAEGYHGDYQDRGGRRFQFGEGWNNSRRTVHFWNPLISFQKETDARCYASVTAYVMMIPACNSCSAQSKRPKRSRS